MKIKSIITCTVLASIISSPIYAGNDKNDKGKVKHLPPGLHKKAMKGQPLPPGWQKKLAKGAVMDINIYQQSRIVVPVDKKGLITVKIEGKLVRLFKLTREIVEVID